MEAGALEDLRVHSDLARAKTDFGPLPQPLGNCKIVTSFPKPKEEIIFSSLGIFSPCVGFLDGEQPYAPQSGLLERLLRSSRGSEANF